MARDKHVAPNITQRLIGKSLYACTPRSSTETGQLHCVGLGEHVKGRQAVQGAPRIKSLCVHLHAEAVFSWDILYLQM